MKYLKAIGAQAVKIWFFLDPGRTFVEMEAVVMAAGVEARMRGLPLLVHGTGLREAKVGLRAGARVLVHSVEDQPIDDEFLDLARASDVIYLPTLTVRGGYASLRTAFMSREPLEVEDPLACVDPATRAKLIDVVVSYFAQHL